MPTVQFGVHVIDYAATDDRIAWHVAWHFDALPTTSAAPDLRIRLGSGLVDAPKAPPGVVDGPLERWLEADSVVLRHESGVTGRVDGAALMIDSSRLDPTDWRPSRQLLFNGLSWWLERRGVALLHGGLVGGDDEAVLVLGGTGAGKSTIVAAALAHGWQVFADDLVAVRRTDDGVEVTGLPKRMMVAPELMEALDVAATETLPGDARGRFVLPPSVLSVGSRRLRGVVVAGHDRGAGRLEELAHGDVLGVVAGSSLETARPGVLRRQLGLLSAVAGLPAHRLAHARQAGARLATAARLLDEAWGEQDRAAITEGGVPRT